MKRIRIAKGKHVMISTELADKAQRLFGTGLSRDAIRDLSASEPKCSSTLMAGDPRPLALSRRRVAAIKKTTGST